MLCLSILSIGDGDKMAQHIGPKILVIDDEASLLQSIIAYLEDSGFIVFSAVNGKLGLEVYESEHPDLVLTDIHMPIMSGLEVLNAVSKKGTDTPVIVISGAGELNDAIEALRFGAWDFITKPIADLKVLEHAINKALERKNLIAANKTYEQRIAQNLKVLEEDQSAGRRVQMSLLPQGELQVKNYAFDYKIIPSLELSGDFVEYFSVTENIYVTYLADVSGHGASSAFITVLLKSLIAQYLAHYKVNHDESIICPAQIMQILSKEIFTAKLNKYLTIIYGVMNIDTNEFIYGVGGHYPSPILLKQDGTTRYLPGGGFPIGIVEKAAYADHKVILQQGDKIIMLTDGVMELLLPGTSLDHKEPALLEIVKKNNGNISAILDACGVQIGENQPDDVTLLSISYK